jgi:phospholipase/carboxylesterase
MEPSNPPTETPPTTRARLAKLGRRFLGVIFGLSAIILLGPLTLLAFIGESRPGRRLGWLAIALLGAVFSAVALIWPMPRPRLWALIACGTLATLGGIYIAYRGSLEPEGSGGATGLRSVVLGPAAPLKPGAFGNFPEIDTIKLATTLMSRLLPDTTAEHRRRIRFETLRLGREIEANADARPIPSVSALALAELTGRPFDAGHYFAYVPAYEPGERLGAVIFLHGNGGNFKINPWAWRPFAEAHRFAIVCPSYGFGFWGAGGAEAVDRALDDAIRQLPIDPGRVYLAGHSDGGNGVTRTGRAQPARYRGLIYVSPTMNLDEIGSADFLAAWRGRPVIVFQGDADVNVLTRVVDPAVERLRSNGVEVTYRVFPGEDHFLLFGRSAEVFDAIARWMKVPR